MIGDTIDILIGAITVTLRKINQDQYSSEYRFRSSVNQYSLKIRHSQVKGVNGAPTKDRHNIELVETIFAAGAVPEYSHKVYMVWEHEPSDVNVSTVDALSDKLIESTNAILTKLANWES